MLNRQPPGSGSKSFHRLEESLDFFPSNMVPLRCVFHMVHAAIGFQKIPLICFSGKIDGNKLMESAGYMSERCRVLPESDKRQSEEKHIFTSSITSGHLGAFVFVFCFFSKTLGLVWISLVLKGLGSFLWIMFFQAACFKGELFRDR